MAWPHDCVALKDLDEKHVLQNVRERFRRGEIYTYVSHVLMAVNPYEAVPGLYGQAAMAPYVHRPSPGARPSPHVYAVAEVALRGLKRGENQAVVISGESGAGKTETAKIVLKYIEARFGHSTGVGQGSLAVSRSLDMGMVLESFGNARTSRNNNSSRFGKQLQIQVRRGTKGGNLGIYAQTTTYLLEASRVAVRSPDERSFHVFYEMFAGLGSADLSRLGLQVDSRGQPVHRLIGQRLNVARDDKSGFSQLLSCLQGLGLRGQVNGIFEILAGILHLGDVYSLSPLQVDQDGDEETPINENSAILAAKMLGFDQTLLRRAILKRIVQVPGRKSLHMKNRSGSQVEAVLRGFTVSLYTRLFKYLVKRMNEFVAAGMDAPVSNQHMAELVTLDIYGFENLHTNSLDQLLINFTNERLQQMFVRRSIVEEQHLYIQEGLSKLHVKCDDRSHVIRTVSVVLDRLDDASQQRRSRMRTGCDASFCDEIIKMSMDPQMTKTSPKILRRGRPPGRSRPPGTNHIVGFFVTHFAGEVEYCGEGWMDRNDAQSPPELEDLLCESTNPAARVLAERAENPRAAAAPARVCSISRQYRRNLDALLTALNGAPAVHFIRCFKPNAEQERGKFDDKLVLEQLRHSGTLQLLQVMQQGYPHRLKLREVVKRFGSLLPARFQRSTDGNIARSLMLAFEVPQRDWAVGVTHLFMKPGQLALLDDIKEGNVRPNPAAVEAAMRHIVLGRWRRAVHAVRVVLRLARRLRQARVRRIWARQLRKIIFVVRLQRAVGRRRRRAELRRRFRAVGLVVRFLVRTALMVQATRRARALEEQALAERAAAEQASRERADAAEAERAASEKQAAESRLAHAGADANELRVVDTEEVLIPDSPCDDLETEHDLPPEDWRPNAVVRASMASLMTLRQWAALIPRPLQKRPRLEVEPVVAADGSALLSWEQPAKRRKVCRV